MEEKRNGVWFAFADRFWVNIDATVSSSLSMERLIELGMMEDASGLRVILKSSEPCKPLLMMWKTVFEALWLSDSSTTRSEL